MSTAVFAMAYGGPEVLILEDVEVPPPGAGEVTIEVRSAAVNPADLKLAGGLFGDDPARLPMRLGFEVAGVVVAVGDAARGPAGPVAVGDEVIGYPVDGGYAAAITVSASSVLPKPDALSFEEASGLSVVGTAAFHLVEAAGVHAGDTVLIHAVSGGVGFAAAQLALARGASVVGTATERRHESLRGLGLIPVAYGEGLLERVRAVAPDGVDVALDAIGSDEAVDVSLAVVPDRHRIATVAAFDRANDVGIQLLGSGPGADPGTEIRDRARLVLVDLVDQGSLRVQVARSFPLEQVAEAHRLVRDGHAGGKVVLIP